MKVIPLNKSKVARIDDDDYERVNKNKWCLITKKGKLYAGRHIWVYGGPHPITGKKYSYKRKGRVYEINGYYKSISLHRFILNAPDNLLVDHIDGNGLNNQKSNLRLCTASQNCMNSKTRSTSSSGYRGVTWDAQTKKWRATITQNGKMKNLGRFTEIADAIEARNSAEKKVFGEFARLM